MIVKAFSNDILHDNKVDLELISSENSENRSSEIKIKTKTNTFEIKNEIEITDCDLETGLEIKIDLEIPNTGIHKRKGE